MPRGSGLTDGNIVIGTSVDMYGINEGLSKIEKSWRRLQRVTNGLIGVAGLVKFGKAALDAASNLTEVQNIVDVSFEDMAYKAEEFASVAVEQFGMSELSAKQTAGSFMAMGKAAGIALDEASNMAIQLTALTGDMASFYNISQDYARVALSAVYTGETETLKRYGIILTEANLQEYASTLGIQKKVKAMGAAEKVMLRYRYILETTKDISGDFIRTEQTWANQVRLLKEHWKQLLIVMGNGLTTVLGPVLAGINAIVEALIKFNKIVAIILSNIFGKSFSGVQNNYEGISSSASDAAEAEDELADATAGAAKAAKKSLAPWDDLNVLQKKTSGGSGAGGGVVGDFELPDYTDAFDILGKINDLLDSNINTLFGLGRFFSDTFRNVLDDIDWESVYRGARDFGKGFAKYLNGLITPKLFASVGRTIANALNTAIYAALEFGTEFNWKNLGRSIAAGVNSAFDNFDFKALGESINAWLKGILDMLITALQRIDWPMIGRKFGEFLLTIDVLEIAGKFIHALIKAMSAALQVYINALDVAPIETAFVTLLALPRIFKALVSTQIVGGLISVGKTIKDISTYMTLTGVETKAAQKELKRLVAQNPKVKILGNLLLDAQNSAKTFSWTTKEVVNQIKLGKSPLKAFNNGLTTLNKGMTNIKGQQIVAPLSTFSKVLIGATAALGEFFVVSRGFEHLATDCENVALEVTKIGAAIAGAGVALSIAFGSAGIGFAVAGIVGLIAALKGLYDGMKQLQEVQAQEVFDNFVQATSSGTHTLSDFRTAMQQTVSEVTVGLDEVKNKFTTLEETRGQLDKTITSIETISLAMQSGRKLTENEIEQLGSAFDQLKTQLQSAISASYDYVIAETMADYQYLQSQGQVTDAVKQKYADRIQGLLEAKQAQIDNAAGVTEAVSGELQAYIDLQQKFEEGTATEAELQAQQDALKASIVDLMDATSSYSGVADTMGQAVSNAKTEMEKFAGGLDLSNEALSNYDDVVSTVSDTIDSVSKSFSDGYATITDDLKSFTDELNNQVSAGELTKEEAEKLLADHITTTNNRLSELKTAYGDNLKGINDDLLQLIPQITQTFSDQWDNADPKTQIANKIKYGTKDEYVKQNLDEWVNKVFGGDGGLSAKLTDAFSKGDLVPETTLQESANSIVDTFFNEFLKDDTLPVTELKDNWQEQFNTAFSSIDASAGFTALQENLSTAIETGSDTVKQLMDNYSADTVQGYVDGIENRRSLLSSPMEHMGVDIDKAFHDSALNFGSPSKRMEQYAEWTIEGYNNKLTELSSTTGPIVTAWATNISNAINTFDFKTSFDSIGNCFRTSWENMTTWFTTTGLVTLQTSLTNFSTSVTEGSTTLNTSLLETWQLFPETLTETVMTPLQDMLTAFVDFNDTEVATPFETKWTETTTTLKTGFDTLFTGITTGIKSAMNVVLTTVGNTINSIVDSINSLLRDVNTVSTQASSIPGVSLPQFSALNKIPIPKLAKGAVIPPNKEFMAILGDQKRGTNIEAPLDTIIDAMRQALGSMGSGQSQPINLQIDGQTLARLMVPYDLDELQRRGYNIDVLNEV